MVSCGAVQHMSWRAAVALSLPIQWTNAHICTFLQCQNVLYRHLRVCCSPSTSFHHKTQVTMLAACYT